MIDPLFRAFLDEIKTEKPELSAYIDFLVRFSRVRPQVGGILQGRIEALPSWEIGYNTNYVTAKMRALEKGDASARSELKHLTLRAVESLQEKDLTVSLQCSGHEHRIALVRAMRGGRPILAYPLDHPDENQIQNDQLLAVLAGEESCFIEIHKLCPGWKGYWFDCFRAEALLDPYLEAIQQLHPAFEGMSHFLKTFKRCVSDPTLTQPFLATSAWQVHYNPQLLPPIVYGSVLKELALVPELRLLLREHTLKVPCQGDETHRVAIARRGSQILAAFPLDCGRHLSRRGGSCHSESPCVEYALELLRHLGRPQNFEEAWQMVP
jgi:hypothetical protein